MTRPAITFSALGILLFIAPTVWLLNEETIAQLFTSSAIAQPPLPFPPPAPSPNASPGKTPQRLTITVSVADPDDLKVKESQDLKRGDLIADRGRERDRLTAQKQQLTLNLSRLQAATITRPLPPATSPVIAQLPTPSYLEEQANIDRAQAQVQQIITLKVQEIQYLQSLENLEPLVLEHEQAKLSELNEERNAKVNIYFTA